MPNAPFAGFAERLHKALDYAGFVTGRARTAALAAQHDVSRETARKWLSGLAMPELERMIEIAVQHDVSFEWLATGRGVLRGDTLSVREPGYVYGDREEQRILGLIRRLSPKKRKAVLELLED